MFVKLHSLSNKSQVKWLTPVIGVFLLLSGRSLLGQDLEVTAYVNRGTVGLDQQFELVVELNGAEANNVSQPSPPNIDEFAAYIGSSSSTNMQIVNGQMSVSKSYTYRFIATKEGKFQIPAIAINHRGKTFSSDPIPIEIGQRRATAAPRSLSNRARTNDSVDLADQLFLRASVDNGEVYQNQPVVITYKIYTAVNITSYAISQLPNTVGFWSEDFPAPQRPRLYDEVVNGRRYRVAEIKKVALFAQGPGTKELDPMIVDCEVQLRRERGRRDIFDSFFDDPFFSSKTERRSIRSNKLTIEVRSLPENGKPVDFSGAVGDYSISANTDNRAVKTNEAVTLTVKIAGTGNINILPQPKVDFPSDFEVYDPKISTNINRKGAQIRGSKTFEFVLIPRFPGNQTLKPISFSFFDLKSQGYRTASTDAIEISVAKGDQPLVTAPIGSSKEDVRFIGQDIRFIQTQMPTLERIGPAFYKTMPFYLVLILPLFVMTSAWAYRKHLDKLTSNVAYARSRKANQMALKRLRTANKKMQEGNSRDFYGEVSNALMGFIGDKLNVPAAGLITDQVDTMLRRQGIDETIVANYLECLKSCDFKRFAPSHSDNGEMRIFFDVAKRAIIDLEKAI